MTRPEYGKPDTVPWRSHVISHRWLAAGLLLTGIGLSWHRLWPDTFALHGYLIYPSGPWWCFVGWALNGGFERGWRARAEVSKDAADYLGDGVWKHDGRDT